MPLCPRLRPRDTRTRSQEESRAERHLVSDTQRHVSPFLPSAAQVGAIDEIGHSHDTTDTVIRHAFEMIDEVLTREVLLRHRSVPIVLVANVAMHIHLRWYDGLSRKVDARRARGNLHLTSAAYSGELGAFHDKDGIFNR